MPMTSLNISLPDPLKAYIEDRVASGDFGTPSEFVRNLIRQDKEQRRSRLETELLDALQTKEFVIAPEELNGRSLVAVLREKFARQGRHCTSPRRLLFRLSSKRIITSRRRILPWLSGGRLRSIRR